MKGSRVRYTTIQNWANNVYNLVTKRAVAYEDAQMEWVDGNLGSKLTMKYPSVLHDGTRGTWRDSLHRFRQQGTASRCRRESLSLRPAHLFADNLKEHQQRWWTLELSRLG